MSVWVSGMEMKIKSFCFRSISMWIEIIFSFIKIFSSSFSAESSILENLWKV